MGEDPARLTRGAPASRFGTVLVGAGIWSVVAAIDLVIRDVGARIRMAQFQAQEQQRYSESVTVDLDNMGSPLDITPMPMLDSGHFSMILTDGVQVWQYANPVGWQTASVSFLVSASIVLALTWFAVRLAGAMQSAGALVAGFALVSVLPWFVNSLLYLSFTRFSIAWGFQLALHIAMLVGVYAAARMASRSTAAHAGSLT
jgi:hypothetical protein